MRLAAPIIAALGLALLHPAAADAQDVLDQLANAMKGRVYQGELRDPERLRISADEVERRMRRLAEDPDRPPEYFALYNHLYGVALMMEGRGEEGVDVLSKTFDLYRSTFGATSMPMVYLYMDYGDALRRRGSPSSTWLMAWRKGVDVARKFHGSKSVEYGMFLVQVGDKAIFHYQDEGDKFIRDGYKIVMAAEPKPDPLILGGAEFFMAKLEMGYNRRDKALALLQQSLQHLQGTPADDPDGLLPIVRGFMVGLYEEMGNDEAATAMLMVIGEEASGQQDAMAQPVYQIAPEFPERAVRATQTGTKISRELVSTGAVVVEFTVDEGGYTTDHRIIRADGPKAFADESLKAIRKFRYAPRFVDGVPVATPGVRYMFRFKFDG
ncbi:MAG: energy transducer TonB [Gammaproteobacteria bacterium]|nr:energy transducer TonB [Gammaproteobacteria bacterium]